VRQDFAGEELHRAAHLGLWQAAEVHPAEHLAHAEVAHLGDLVGDGVGRADRERLGDELLPGDVRQPLGRGTKPRLQQRMDALDASDQAAQRLLVPHLGVRASAGRRRSPPRMSGATRPSFSRLDLRLPGLPAHAFT
jgi:hypothetical protein